MVDAKHSTSRTPRLELREITKRYPGVVANEGVSLSVMPGEIHAVLGENGAGKSTLMKIIYGAAQADKGDILWNGDTVDIPHPGSARALGIGMVYQHFSLFETVSVAENVAVALDTPFDLAAISHRIMRVSQEYGLPVEPQRLLYHLSVGERQRVEIVRCLMQDPQLLILDEPTSVLTLQAVRKLFDTLRIIAARGCSILYISHKLEEIRELCERATVLRAGRVAGAVEPKQSTAAELAELMVGATLPRTRRRDTTPAEKLALEVRSLSLEAEDPFGMRLQDISFSLHGGEVLGIAGVSGNGQGELVAALSGERTARKTNCIWLKGEAVDSLAAGERRARGLALVPEERLGRGAVPSMTLADNTSLTAHRDGMVHFGLLDRQRAHAFAVRVIDRFAVKCKSVQTVASALSGGNLQKFIVGRELELSPEVLIVSQPTWGVDVAASAFIRQAIIDLSRQGAAVLLVSEELEEIFEVCDRIMVLHDGRLSAAKRVDETNLHEVGLLMAGVGSHA